MRAKKYMLHNQIIVDIIIICRGFFYRDYERKKRLHHFVVVFVVIKMLLSLWKSNVGPHVRNPE